MRRYFLKFLLWVLGRVEAAEMIALRIENTQLKIDLREQEKLLQDSVNREVRANKMLFDYEG